jgi:hypothetical protein
MGKCVWVDEILKNHVFTAGAGLIKSTIVDLREKLSEGSLEIFERHTGTGTIKIEIFMGPTNNGPWVEATSSDVAAAAASTTDNAYLLTLTHFGPFAKVTMTASAETITAANAWLVTR